jgi:hypothetical protein
MRKKIQKDVEIGVGKSFLILSQIKGHDYMSAGWWNNDRIRGRWVSMR